MLAIEPVFVLLAIFLLVAIPILSIIAFIRVSALQKAAREIPQLISRIYELEQRVKALDARLVHFGAPGAVEPRPATTTPATADLAKPAETTVRQAPSAPPPCPAPVPKTSAIPAWAPAPRVSPRVTAARSAPPGGGQPDAENTLAGRWFNYVGILAIALAIAFFLKYAFDNNWIGPVGRVTIGLIVGAVMYPLSHWVLNRSYRYYSEGIAGLGAAILYLSLWSGWHYYHLFPQSVAFPLMIVVTGMTVIVAVGRNSDRIAVLALIGGLLTPILVSTGENAEVTLFSYLAVLSAALLGIARMRNWRSIAPVQFAGSIVYFWGWYADFYTQSELGLTVVFATLFFALFASLPAIRSTHAGELPSEDIAIVLTNAFQYLTALRLILWPGYRWALTFAALGLAAVH